MERGLTVKNNSLWPKNAKDGELNTLTPIYNTAPSQQSQCGASNPARSKENQAELERNTTRLSLIYH
jgi:hypothetical protein